MGPRTRAARRALALCLIVAPGASLRAQDHAPSPPAAAGGGRSCPAPGAPVPPNDTLRATLQLWLEDAARLPLPARAFAEGAVQELAHGFVRPASLTIAPRFLHLYVDPKDAGVPPCPWLDAQLEVVVAREGQARRVRLASLSDALELNPALLDAASRADSAGALGPLPDYVGRDSLVMRVRLGQRPPRGATALPLVAMTIPYVRLDRPASQIPRTGQAPEYPEIARSQGIEETVLAQFVVTEAGRADMSSVRFLRVGYRDFAEAVLRALPTFRFKPAEVGGCPVPQVVQVPFKFSLRY